MLVPRIGKVRRFHIMLSYHFIAIPPLIHPLMTPYGG